MSFEHGLIIDAYHSMDKIRVPWPSSCALGGVKTSKPRSQRCTQSLHALKMHELIMQSRKPNLRTGSNFRANRSSPFLLYNVVQYRQYTWQVMRYDGTRQVLVRYACVPPACSKQAYKSHFMVPCATSCSKPCYFLYMPWIVALNAQHRKCNAPATKMIAWLARRS